VEQFPYIPDEVSLMYGGIRTVQREDITLGHQWRTIDIRRHSGTVTGMSRALTGANPSSLGVDYSDGEPLVWVAELGNSFMAYHALRQTVIMAGPVEELKGLEFRVALELSDPRRADAQIIPDKPGLSWMDEKKDQTAAWIRLGLQRDSAVARQLQRVFPDLENKVKLSSLQDQTELDDIYLARVGSNAYMRAGNERIDLLGYKHIISHTAQILMEGLGREVVSTSSVGV
jgi:hypothetical protein